MQELGSDNDSFEEDPLFGESDDDIEKEVARFDRRGKKKSPVVIEISDDDRGRKSQNKSGKNTGKKTLNVKKATAAKGKKVASEKKAGIKKIK